MTTAWFIWAADIILLWPTNPSTARPQASTQHAIYWLRVSEVHTEANFRNIITDIEKSWIDFQKQILYAFVNILKFKL